MKEDKKGRPSVRDFSLESYFRDARRTEQAMDVGPEFTNDARRESLDAITRKEGVTADRAEIEAVKAHIDSIGRDGTRDNYEVLLNGIQRVKLNNKIGEVVRLDRFKMPALILGNETATEYDSQITNYSTQTHIVKLKDGTKLFVIHNYKSSGIHREMDAFMKRRTGCKMRKSKRRDWKKQFESKSTIPVIPCDDPNVIVLPYIPNINLRDLFTRTGKMEDVGECEFAKRVDVSKLLEILTKIVDKIKALHSNGITWGELILPNIIIDEDQEVYICDPETEYNHDVPLDEQKARDLYDLIRSSCAVMSAKYEVSYEKVVKTVLDNYDDEPAILELQALCAGKVGVSEKIFFGYSKARLGLKSIQEMKDIRQAVVDYDRDFELNKI